MRAWHAATLVSAAITHASACTLGACAATPALSCVELFNSHGRVALNGTFWVQPVGAPQAYEALCEGDGWELALRADGRTVTWGYDSPLWTDGNLLNANVSARATDAKLAPFVYQPGNELLLRLTAPGGGQRGGDLRLSVPSFASLRALLAGSYAPTSAPRGNWSALVPGGATLLSNCNAQGINLQLGNFPPHVFRLRQRIGFATNQELDCNSPDTAIGVGVDIAVSYCGSLDTFATTGQWTLSCYIASVPSDFHIGSVYRGTAALLAEVYVRGSLPTPTQSPSPTSSSSMPLISLPSPTYSFPVDAGVGLTGHTVSGAPAYLPDRCGNVGGALRFSLKLAVTSPAGTLAPAGNAPRTLSVWVWCAPGDNPAGVYKQILGLGSTRAAGASFSLGVGYGTPPGLVHTGHGGRDWTTNTAVCSSEWTHLAATFNGSTLSLYVNGSFLGSRTSAFNTVSLGVLQGWNGDPLHAGGEHWTGAMDDVAVYNVSLSAAQVRALATAGCSAPPRPSIAPPCSVGANASRPAESCSHLLDQCGIVNTTAWVLPSRAGSVEPFLVHCADGGWTLAAVVDGALTTFSYNASLWTSTELLNGGALSAPPATGRVEAKLRAFVDAPGTEIRLVMRTPSSGDTGQPLVVGIPGGFTSLRALFASGGFISTNASLDAWVASLPGNATFQPWSWQGVNVIVDGRQTGHPWDLHAYRLGIVFDDNAGADGNPDASLGVGAAVSYTYNSAWGGESERWRGKPFSAGAFVGPCDASWRCVGHGSNRRYAPLDGTTGTAAVATVAVYIRAPPCPFGVTERCPDGFGEIPGSGLCYNNYVFGSPVPTSFLSTPASNTVCSPWARDAPARRPALSVFLAASAQARLELVCQDFGYPHLLSGFYILNGTLVYGRHVGDYWNAMWGVAQLLPVQRVCSSASQSSTPTPSPTATQPPLACAPVGGMHRPWEPSAHGNPAIGLVCTSWSPSLITVRDYVGLSVSFSFASSSVFLSEGGSSWVQVPACTRNCSSSVRVYSNLTAGVYPASWVDATGCGVTGNLGCALLWAFTNASGAVIGRPGVIVTNEVYTVPEGAHSVSMGLNDFHFCDNTGSQNATVCLHARSSRSASSTSTTSSTASSTSSSTASSTSTGTAPVTSTGSDTSSGTGTASSTSSSTGSSSGTPTASRTLPVVATPMATGTTPTATGTTPTATATATASSTATPSPSPPTLPRPPCTTGLTTSFVDAAGTPLGQLRLTDDTPGGALVGLIVWPPCGGPASLGASHFDPEPTAQCTATSSDGVALLLRPSSGYTSGGFPTHISGAMRLRTWWWPQPTNTGWLAVAALSAFNVPPGTQHSASLVCTVQATLVHVGGASPTTTLTASVPLPIIVTRAAWPAVGDVLVHDGGGAMVRSARLGGEGVNATRVLVNASAALETGGDATSLAVALDSAVIVQAALRSLGLFPLAPPPPPPRLPVANSEDGSATAGGSDSFIVSAMSGSRVTLVAAGARFARFPPGTTVSVGAAPCAMVWLSADGALAHCRLPERAAAHGATTPDDARMSRSSLLLPLIMSWSPLVGLGPNATAPDATAPNTTALNATAPPAASRQLALSCPPFCPGSPWASVAASWPPPSGGDPTPVRIGVPVALAPRTSASSPSLLLADGGGMLVPAWSAVATTSSGSALRLASAADIAADLAASSGVQLFVPCHLAPPGTPSPATGVCANASDPRSAACLYGEGDACRPCPDGALCPGGFRLWSRPGSFVATPAAAVAVPCPPPADERCVGWDARAGTTQCGAAYRAGSFTCVGCAPRHYAAQDGVCEPCPQLSGGGVLALLVALLSFVVGLAAFVGANYAAIRIIVHWRGGTIRGGIKRSLSLFVWMFGTLQLVAVVCSTAAPGLPPALRGLVSVLNVFTFEALVPPAACWPGTPPLAMQLRVMALALALAVAWPLVSVLAAWVAARAARLAASAGALGSAAPVGADDEEVQEGALGGVTSPARGASKAALSGVGGAVDAGAQVTAHAGVGSDGEGPAAGPRTLAERWAALRRSIVPELPTAAFSALGLLFPLVCEYALAMLHCRSVAVPLGTYVGMDRGAGPLTAASASVRSLLEGGDDGGAVVLSAALADGSLRAALAAPVTVDALQHDPHFVCWAGSHAPVGVLAAFTLVGVALAVPAAAAWLLWMRAARATARAGGVLAGELAPAKLPGDRPPEAGAMALAAAGIGNEFEEGREWLAVMDMGAIVVMSLVLVLLKEPYDGPSVAARLAVTLLVLAGLAGVYQLRCPYHPRDPWKLVAKQCSLLLAALAAVLSAAQVLQGPSHPGTVALSYITFLAALAVFALIVVAFWLALMDGASREAAAAVAAAAAATRGCGKDAVHDEDAVHVSPPAPVARALRLHTLFSSRALTQQQPSPATDDPSGHAGFDGGGGTVESPFTAVNPMRRSKEAAKSVRALATRDEEEFGDDAFQDESLAAASGGGGRGSGEVRALRALYQSRHAGRSSALPPDSALATQQRVTFVGGTRIVRAASTRQLGSLGQGARSRRADFAPSRASAAEQPEE